jgi:hypothetical protein
MNGQKTLGLRLEVTADTSRADKAMKAFADEARKVAGAMGRAGGGVPSPGDAGSAWSRVAAGADRAMSTMQSPVSAFGRPTPVILLGPKVLQVEVVKGLGGKGGGGGGSAADAEKEKEKEKGGLDLFAKLGVALAVLNQLSGSIQATGNVVNDPYLTSQQAGRRLFRGVVPFGGTIQDTVDSISGRKFGMEGADIGGRFRGADVEARMRLAEFNQSNSVRVAGKAGLAEAYARGSAVAPPVVDRSTARGEQEYRDAMKLLPFRQQIAQAERESAVAAKERSAAEGEFVKLTTKENQLRADRQKIERELQRPSNGAGVSRQDLLRRQENLDQEASGLRELRQQARQRVGELRERETGVRGEEAKARLRLDTLGQAEILDERAARGISGAERLGMMNPFQQQAAVDFVKLVKNNNPSFLPPQVVQTALDVAPDATRERLRQAGKASPAFRELQKYAPTDFPAGDPDDLRRRADELRERAAKLEYGIATAVAGDVRREAETLGADIGKMFKDFARDLKNAILKEIRLGRNQ